ncbi:hypothetical protein HYPBUDRAFT_180195 [Hyphopichia burtonii NRRL Y-1933]|uniref:Uncharacterized protein n=1 Tax=Hyphopichia burtonii NRRL Y-1933 TaxID=984485 RepID=A0A1E4RTB7_9ASCO|nr:hypothetical protein HYPBUDRAFT_180195 [Hyphopichia burtonii NRRL Y-1933]ODV70295.1 hypothetical protein HYPBUDRAFT_180195 [Hyphopichia burtonii NRRL Y-1933]
MLSTSLSKSILSKPLVRGLMSRQYLSYSTSGPGLNFSPFANLTNTQKLALSVSGYLLACLGVVSIAERKKFSHVFKQLGEW